jgi:hypothetical protein
MSPNRPPIRTVFDCMVFLQASARREGPAAALLLVELLSLAEIKAPFPDGHGSACVFLSRGRKGAVSSLY